MSAMPDVTEAQFFEMVDRFLGEANAFGQRLPPSRVSAALLFAAARFNAFNWINRGERLEQTLDEGIALFGIEYEKMFRDNVQQLMQEKNG